MMSYSCSHSFLQVLHVSWSKVTVAIDLVSYLNKDGAGIHEDRCDVLESGCNHIFILCLDDYYG